MDKTEGEQVVEPLVFRMEDLPTEIRVVDRRGGQVEYVLTPAGRKPCGAALQKKVTVGNGRAKK